MDLAKLEFRLRPRAHWEAIDLGFALARRWYWPLITLWLATALPLTLLLTFFFYDNLILVSFLLWWGKPLYEPLLIYWLSRAVFGEQPPLRELVRGWWRISRPGLLGNLTLYRFNPSRSFAMPVGLLEGLKGKARRQRNSVLGRNQHAATWLTIVGIHFETILEFGFLITIFSLIPEQLRWGDMDYFLFDEGLVAQSLQLASWVVAMAIIAPFYVAGGFSLYLHRRSELEGWDIEINFRRTVEKLSPQRTVRATMAVALLALLAFSGIPQESAADTGAQQSKEAIEQVLADERFGKIAEESYWKYVGQEEKEEEPDEDFLDAIGKILEVIGGWLKGTASALEIILWALGLGLIAFLIYHLTRNSAWMQAALGGNSGPRRELPSQLFGLDVTPDSLPEDIAEEALQLLRSGKLRPALSLLYRGALVHLITDHQLDIPGSATEGECLRLVQQTRGGSEADFFARLTQLWLTTAYAHIKPASNQVEQLCLDWQQVYGHGER